MRAQELRGALEAADARLLGEWDKRRVWRLDGAKSGAAWLASRQHLPVAETRRRLRHARAVRRFPAIGHDWARGAIDRCHITTLMGACTVRTGAAFEAEHPKLLEAARTRRFADFKRQVDTWTYFRDPDGAEQDDKADEAAREVHLSESFDGMWFGRMTFDPVNGTIVNVTLRGHRTGAVRGRLGRGQGTPRPGTRSSPSSDAPPPSAEPTPWSRWPSGPAPHPPTAAGPHPCSPSCAAWRPSPDRSSSSGTAPSSPPAPPPGGSPRPTSNGSCSTSPSRVIDVGATRRFFTGALRRAIEVRDRTCFHDLCDEPPQRPQIDHIVEASKGGLTTQTNGRLGCGFHNRWRNHHPDAGPDPPDDEGRGRTVRPCRPRRSASIISVERPLGHRGGGQERRAVERAGERVQLHLHARLHERERVEDAFVAQRVELHRRDVGRAAARSGPWPGTAPRTATRRERSSPPR